jgi:hypothetical protein
MTTLSVLVPTANRPGMLRTALRSIAAQTAVSAVGEVVVIENLGNRESGRVCQEFPQLPISYVFRDPPLPPGSIAASRDALGRIHSERMAILFDDDWWMEQHLETAIKSFDQWPHVIASFAVCLWTSGEAGYLDGTYGSFLPWFGAAQPLSEDRWTLTVADLLVISHLNSTFHLSSMVVNTDVFRSCIESTFNGNPYDTDRIIPAELGRHGRVVYNSRPQVYVRTHRGREALRLTASGEANVWWDSTTDQLFELAEKTHVDLKKEFAERMTSKQVTLDDLRRYSNPRSCARLIERGIIEVPSSPDSKSSAIKDTCRALTPPVLWNLLAKWRSSPPSPG